MKTKKSEEKIKGYLKSKSVLLVTLRSTDRTAWKKLFVELGVGLSNFHNASSVKDAQTLIDTQKIDIVFTSYSVSYTHLTLPTTPYV